VHAIADDNHVHLLMTRTPMTGYQGHAILGRRYVHTSNCRYIAAELCGRQAQSQPGAGDRYLLACYRYIELTRSRAAMVRNPADYCWSSHRPNAYGEWSKQLNPTEPTPLGETPETRLSSYRETIRGA